MKKLNFLAAALCLSLAASAQTEIKINPIGLFFGDLSISSEFGLSEDFGLEPFVGIFNRTSTLGSDDWKLTSLQIGALGKYYFSPKKGIDKFHIGLYTRFGTGKWKFGSEETNTSRLALGFYLGYKWVNSKGFVIELGGGLGRAFINNIDNPDLEALNFDVDGIGRFAIGYRFGGGDSSSSRKK